MTTRTVTLGPGRFRRVRSTTNPLDDTDAGTLAAATNLYLSDPIAGGGAYARPGTVQWSTAPNTGDRGQAAYCHRGLDGTNYNFLVVDGKLYRQSTNLTSAPVDVTPTNVAIASVRFVSFESLDDSLIVTDGYNPPWIGTNLGSTPITATLIPYTPAVVKLQNGSNDRQVGVNDIDDIIVGDTWYDVGGNPSVALPAGTIPADQWGSYRVTVNSAGTITVTAASATYTTGYASEAAAIAALPSWTPDSAWNVGTFTVQTGAGNPFVAGTDSLQGGGMGNPSNDTNYYAGNPPPWTTYGRPVIYAGAVFFILNRTDTADYARTTITWSEPNDPAVGYQQTNYDNNWTLTQTSMEPLTALAATNGVLYYFRAYSIGGLAGAPNVNFVSTATHDAVSGNVGCGSFATVQVFLNTIFFCDRTGRPHRFATGGIPEPLWRQAETVFDATDYAAWVPLTWWSVLEPNLNVYVVGYGTSTATAMMVFDALTGVYFGTWNWASSDAAGLLRDANGLPQMVTIGGHDFGASALWKLARVADAVWTDNGGVPSITARTGWLGHTLGGSTLATEVRLGFRDFTGAVQVTVVGTEQSVGPLSQTGVANVTATLMKTRYPLSVRGRGAQITVTPATVPTQFRLFEVEVDLVVSKAGPTDR